MPLSEEQVWRRRARDALERDGELARGGAWSIETGPCARGRPALERGGTSPEGASGPRARRNLARGGDRSSSEAKLYRLKASRPLIRILVINDNHYGLTILFEL
jgi:hypothetical protein